MPASSSALPLHLDQLSNSYPVFLFSKDGVAHDVEQDLWHTRCGKSWTGDQGHWVTLVQVHAWLQRAFCHSCFH